MSDRFHDDEERSLKQLFDETAPEPERAQLDRLARFAAQVPARTVPLWRRWLLRAPALALAFAGATVLALWLGRSSLGTLQVMPPRPTAAPIGEAPIIEEDDPLAFEVDEEDEYMLDDPLAALDSEDGDSPLALLDLLAMPDEPEALESWSAAYERSAPQAKETPQ